VSLKIISPAESYPQVRFISIAFCISRNQIKAGIKLQKFKLKRFNNSNVAGGIFGNQVAKRHSALPSLGATALNIDVGLGEGGR